MPAYWIAHIRITDPEAYGRYASLATGAIESHGGRFLARSGRYKQLEGNDRARNVLVEFPSLEAAETCYNSPAYRAALAHAKGAAERDLVIVEGL
jgi:uncharacterized protein (DUF1330 family)